MANPALARPIAAYCWPIARRWRGQRLSVAPSNVAGRAVLHPSVAVLIAAHCSNTLTTLLSVGGAFGAVCPRYRGHGFPPPPREDKVACGPFMLSLDDVVAADQAAATALCAVVAAAAPRLAARGTE